MKLILLLSSFTTLFLLPWLPAFQLLAPTLSWSAMLEVMPVVTRPLLQISVKILTPLAVILGGFATFGIYLETRKERIKAELAMKRVQEISDEIARMAGHISVNMLAQEDFLKFSVEEKQWLHQHVTVLLLHRAVGVLEKSGGNEEQLELFKQIRNKTISALKNIGYTE